MFRTMLFTGAEAFADAAGAAIGQDVGADFALTADEQERLTAAQHEFNRDPVRNAGGLVSTWLRMRDRAVLATKEAEIEKRVEGRVRREFEAKAAEEQARTTREATRGQGGPTAASGVPPNGAWGSQRQIDMAHAMGEITSAQVRQLRDSGVYGRLEY